MSDQMQSSSNTNPFVGPGPLVEPTLRWIRVQFGEQIIADSKRALLLIQYGPRQLPTYYFPQADVRMEALEPAVPDEQSEGMEYFRLRVGDKVADRAAWVYRDPPPALEALRGYVSFAWDAMDAWYEEAEQIFVH